MLGYSTKCTQVVPTSPFIWILFATEHICKEVARNGIRGGSTFEVRGRHDSEQCCGGESDLFLVDWDSQQSE